MKPFLEELAEKIIQKHPTLDELTIVFPNRRAALFFGNYLSQLLKEPAWTPNLITIEEFFKDLSPLQEADRLSLIFKLYHVYRSVMKIDESFDRFYFWGDMLLRDFEEVDKYLAPPATLFKDLSNWRELDESFDSLTEEQKKFLKDFWLNFGDKPIGNKEEFLKIWRKLPKIYASFTQELRKAGIGYEGMIHREVSEKIAADTFKDKRKKSKKGGESGSESSDLIFAGFNALTRAEEVLISHFVKTGAAVYWDSDPYYIQDTHQEAGMFFRQYSKHKVLGATFDKSAFSNFKGLEKKVDLYGVPQKVGQAKLLGKLLEEGIIPKLKSKGGTEDEVKTVIVLPDESMLLPVMHSLPEALDSVNVTMGYPLRSTPVYNLVELLIDLQIHKKESGFSHRQVTVLLAHPYVLADNEPEATRLRLEIIQKNRIFIGGEELGAAKGLLEILFQPVDAEGITTYLLAIIKHLGAGFTDDQSFDREYAFHFYTTMARLSDILKESGSQLDLKGFQKLFRQVTLVQKIPFTGEPLKGLQIMGVLETRNLDFDNVFILSLNEGSWPASPRQGSYIPHAIRKAYGLPTHDHQDAMYAYLFYRVLQRAKNITLLYNTEPDILGMGEMSRFVQQLIYESGWKIDHHILNNLIEVNEAKPITVAKTETVLKALDYYKDPEGRGIAPSALNDYIECSLRFYLKHIARLREKDEVNEELDARIFGNFLHNVMDWFYQDLITRKGSKEILEEDLKAKSLEGILLPLIDRAFHEHYHIAPDRKIEYIGQRVVVRAIVLQFAEKILEIDREHTPFKIEMLEEKKFNAPFDIVINGTRQSVIIGGRIDRVDSKDGSVRVIDYKTGNDRLDLESVDSLFKGSAKRNKAAFQTFLYSWLYDRNASESLPVRPLLMNRANIFGEDGLKNFKLNRSEITDVRLFFPEFTENLKKLLEEMFSPEISFTQTTEEKNCQYCNFKSMCRR